MSESEDFLFTIPSGEPVQLEPFHYAIVGQTQFSGKTTLIKRLASWAEEQGFRVLVFDTKETEADYAGFGREVPVCLRETTDSFVLIGLLESMFKRRLTPYYATLSRITEGAKGFQDIIERAKEKESKTRSSWLKDACRVLYDLLERLQAETSKFKTVPTLQLHKGINRMVINDFSLEAQQLIVKNAFEDALREYKRDLVMVLDEAFKFLPQGYSSPATRSVMQVITQGAKTGLYTWISTQFLAVTDKDPLKACAIKFLGTQDHTTEVKHTLDLIPEVRGKFSKDDIMKLKLGHWVLVRKRPPDVRVVYALPVGVPSKVGRNVAVGEATPEFVRDSYLKKKEVEDELVWKERYEKLKSEVERLDHERSEMLKTIQDLMEERDRKVQEAYRKAMEKLEEIKKQWNVEEYQQTIAQLKDEKARLEAELKRLEPLKAFKEAFSKAFEIPAGPLAFEPGSPVPSEIAVVTEQPALTVEVVRKPLTLNESNLEGRIAIVYAEGLLPTDKWFTVTDVYHAMRSHGWPRDPRASKMLDQFCQWAFFEKRYAGKRPEYKVRMAPTEAKEKGLLKTVEKKES